MTEQNCEVIMISLDMEYIGLQELVKETAIMIPVKAYSDCEKSIEWGMVLAEKLDLWPWNNEMKRLCKIIDNFIELEQIDASVYDSYHDCYVVAVVAPGAGNQPRV